MKFESKYKNFLQENALENVICWLSATKCILFFTSTATAASVVEMDCKFPKMTYYQFGILKNSNPMGENCYGRLPDTSTVHSAGFIEENLLTTLNILFNLIEVMAL